MDTQRMQELNHNRDLFSRERMAILAELEGLPQFDGAMTKQQYHILYLCSRFDTVMRAIQEIDQEFDDDLRLNPGPCADDGYAI